MKPYLRKALASCAAALAVMVAPPLPRIRYQPRRLQRVVQS